MLVAILALLAFIAATIRLLVVPTADEPRTADAIVMFAGLGDRRSQAVELARAGYAPVLVVSTPADMPCEVYNVPHDVEVLCFRPDPVTTQGEARELARLADARGWNTVLVIAGRPQVTRARIRISRCYDGTILMDAVNPPAKRWPYALAYEWGALVKAVTWQRRC